MKKIVITCDHCNGDLSETANSIDWRIVIKNENIPCAEGPIVEALTWPKLDKDHHFCGLLCLKKWAKSI